MSPATANQVEDRMREKQKMLDLLFQNGLLPKTPSAQRCATCLTSLVNCTTRLSDSWRRTPSALMLPE